MWLCMRESAPLTTARTLKFNFGNYASSANAEGFTIAHEYVDKGISGSREKTTSTG